MAYGCGGFHFVDRTLHQQGNKDSPKVNLWHMAEGWGVPLDETIHILYQQDLMIYGIWLKVGGSRWMPSWLREAALCQDDVITRYPLLFLKERILRLLVLFKTSKLHTLGRKSEILKIRKKNFSLSTANYWSNTLTGSLF